VHKPHHHDKVADHGGAQLMASNHVTVLIWFGERDGVCPVKALLQQFPSFYLQWKGLTCSDHGKIGLSNKK